MIPLIFQKIIYLKCYNCILDGLVVRIYNTPSSNVLDEVIAENFRNGNYMINYYSLTRGI